MKKAQLIILAIILTVGVLTGCVRTEAASADTENLQAQIQTLKTQIAQLRNELDAHGAAEIDAALLLWTICHSQNTLEEFPGVISRIETSDSGYIAHTDKWAYNPDFEPGSTNEEDYLINDKKVFESINTAGAYVQYGQHVALIDADFVDYIKTFDNGMAASFYVLGDKVLLISEIAVP